MRFFGCLSLVLIFAFSMGCSEDETVFPSQKDAISLPTPDKGVAVDQGKVEDKSKADQTQTSDQGKVDQEKVDQAVLDQSVTPDQ